MKISTRTRYGIRATIELAQHYKKGPLQLRIIAERQDISVKYLEQLMAVLRSAALVRSVRGAKGGYMLAKAPEEVRLSDVFHCLEGPVATSECVDNTDFCERAIDCVARELWTQVEEAINKVMDAVTLRDMVERAKQPDRADYQI
ncbi:RrF2 family transcriptional regulator [Planctomycetota bacterium]